MKKVFSNANKVDCIFTDEGVAFSGDNVKEEIFFPYGCIDNISMSFLGVFQVTSHARICTFAVERKDKAEMKEMIKYAKEAIKSAPDAEVQITSLENKKDNADSGMSKDELLKKYKAEFIQGKISKEEYDARKRQLQ